MIKPEEARKIIARHLPAPEIVTVSIEASLGSVIAEDIISDIDIPPFNKSAMDGYAMRATDLRRAPVELQVIETVPAGKFPRKSLKPGKAIKIMTGAPIPAGADTVIMIEKTEEHPRNKTVRPLVSMKKDENICYQSEDLKKGARVISAGSLIRPQEIGVLAAVGKARVKVFKKPTVAVLATGDELVEIHTKPKKAQIRNSNNYSIAAQIRRMGLEVVDLGIARDNLGQLFRKISRGLNYDILIISGGVSVGKYDIVGEVLKKLKVRILFDKVAIKPGKPFVFGKRRNTLIFALPGNPVSSFVVTEVFIRPVMATLTGNNHLLQPVVKTKLTTPFLKPSNRLQYIPARVENRIARAVEYHGSADLVSLTRTNAFLIIPPDTASIKPNEPVDAMMID